MTYNFFSLHLSRCEASATISAELKFIVFLGRVSMFEKGKNLLAVAATLSSALLFEGCGNQPPTQVPLEKLTTGFDFYAPLVKSYSNPVEVHGTLQYIGATDDNVFYRLYESQDTNSNSILIETSRLDSNGSPYPDPAAPLDGTLVTNRFVVGNIQTLDRSLFSDDSDAARLSKQADHYFIDSASITNTSATNAQSGGQ